MSIHSTAGVATLVGISKNTLLNWLYSGKIPEPRRRVEAGIEVRLWNDRDVSRVRKYKELNFRKGRGRKKIVPN
jgi:predicted site-specific integrase-resolvase